MQSEVNQEENLNTTDFDEHFAKISSYIVDTLHGVPLEMTEDEKEQFRIQVISNQYGLPCDTRFGCNFQYHPLHRMTCSKRTLWCKTPILTQFYASVGWSY